MYSYGATLDRVVDGDTVDLNIDLGLDIWKNNTRVRLHHIDTPEKRTRDLLEKHFGFISSAFVLDKMINATQITVTTTIDGPTDKYGRVLGVIWVDNELESINDQLIRKHYAVKYEGQNKSDIADEHINNMRYLVENAGLVLPNDIQTLYEQLS